MPLPRALTLPAMAFAVAACAVPDPHDARVGLQVGARSLRDPAFARLDSQAFVRVDGEIRPSGSPVWLTGGIGAGQDSYEESRRFCFIFCVEDSVTVSSTTVDGTVGARHWGTFDDSEEPTPGGPRWFVGAGAGFVHVDLDRYLGNLRKEGDQDLTFGGYLELGAEFPIGDVRVGGHVRSFRGGDVTLFGEDAKADFDEFGVYVAVLF